MQAPEGLSFTADHAWVAREPGRVRVGITDFAQEALGEVVFVSLPAPGARLVAGDLLAEVESTKAVSEVYAPLAGTVLERNEALLEAPGAVNGDPYGAGWLCVLALDEGDENPGQGDLLDAAAYRALTAS